MALYSRLFPRSGREKSHLEDFLTEALADLFNRCSADEKRGFLRTLIGDQTVLDRLIDCSQQELTCNTQVVIEGQWRPDMVIRDAIGAPLVVIENKIAAAIGETEPGSDGPDANSERDNQLQRYDRWLSATRTDLGPGVLVLLTHITPPPDDFTERSARYTSIPKTARWSAVYRWLVKLGSEGEGVQRVLATELALFLKEQNMDSELSFADLAAASFFVRSGERLRGAFEEIYAHVRARYETILGETNFVFQPNSHRAALWSWRYFVQRNKSAYVGWGLLFPSQLLDESKWPSEAPLSDCAFISIGSDKPSEFKLGAKAKPTSWEAISFKDTDVEWFKIRPAADFFQRDRRFVDLFCEWLDSELPPVLDLIDKA